MATKGQSYQYGNTNGSRGKGESTKHIAYKFAKAFNKSTLNDHFMRHKSDFGYSLASEYENHAIQFANIVDRKNNVSFVDDSNTTYKYNIKSNVFAVIKDDGTIITYFKPKEGIKYYIKQKKERRKK